MKSWMKKIDNYTIICDINLPGTHDSCTKYCQFSFISKCQKTDINEQLNSGIRFLDIRVEKDNEGLKLVHDISACKTPKKAALYLENVIENCKRFLCENPSETILFCFKRDHGASSEETFDSFYKNYLQNDPVWYKENRIPSIGEVRGKIVLLNRGNIDKNNPEYNDFNTGINLSTWVYQKKNTEKIYETAELLGRNGTLTGNSFCVQDLYGLTPQKKWSLAILPFLKNPPEVKDILIAFFSCSSLVYNPKRSANYINKKLAHIALEKQKKYGWIIMDYPTKRFINEIINSNF